MSFITFGPNENLDDQHTVFGELVGGNEVLNKLEMEDRPLLPKILERLVRWTSW